MDSVYDLDKYFMQVILKIFIVMLLLQDVDNFGWCVGRLFDGITGRFYSSFVEDVFLEELVVV